jgi:hypothetical protein
MDVEEYLGRIQLFRRLKCGTPGQLVERYAVRLVEERLVQHGVWRCLNVVSGLLCGSGGATASWPISVSARSISQAAVYPTRRPGSTKAMAVGAAR